MALVPNTKSAYGSKVNPGLNTQRASGMVGIGQDGGKLAVTSTNIEVRSNDQRIGFIQTISPSETRDIIKVRELGTEGVVQSVAGNTTGGQMTVTRFAVYNSNLFNALGLTDEGRFLSRDEMASKKVNPFKTLKEQRVPFEIKVITTLPLMTGEGNNESFSTQQYTETYLDCWLSTYSKTIAANTITITENATIMYSDIC